MKKKLAIGIICYNDNTAKYLPSFLESLSAQTYHDFELFVIDNSNDVNNENYQVLQKQWPQADYHFVGENSGFSRAYNVMIKKAVEKDYEYFLMLNPDMVLEVTMIKTLIQVLEKDLKLGGVIPKILRFHLNPFKKTDRIDSLGLGLDRAWRFFDVDQGEQDYQVERRVVFGFTGAAALLRISALRNICDKSGEHDEYLDELMFMYKEDCDLSMRLFLAAYNVMLVPEAIAYHDRTVAQKGGSIRAIINNRKNKSRTVRIWSFRNNLILLYKYWHLSLGIKMRIRILIYQLASSGYAMIFEPYLLQEVIYFMRILPIIREKRRGLKVQRSIKEIEKFL